MTRDLKKGIIGCYHYLRVSNNPIITEIKPAAYKQILRSGYDSNGVYYEIYVEGSNYMYSGSHMPSYYEGGYVYEYVIA